MIFCLDVELLISISGISATRGRGCARRELGRALKTWSSRENEKNNLDFSPDGTRFWAAKPIRGRRTEGAGVTGPVPLSRTSRISRKQQNYKNLRTTTEKLDLDSRHFSRSRISGISREFPETNLENLDLDLENLDLEFSSF